ncbi:MAG: glycosyltransferase family 39 protein [Clostridium sp.]|nr:glycosyltransferase family 39 protein [Clostridium sp.]
MASNANHSLTKKNTNPNKFQVYFTRFVICALIAMFLILLVTAVGVAIQYKSVNFVNITILAIYLVLTLSFIYSIRKKLDKNKMLIGILAAGFILRFIWAFITPSVPTSDFKTMYDNAHNLLQGDTSAFFGLGYFARFPHMTPYILYLTFIVKYFGANALTVVKGVNILLSTSSIYLVYIICNSIFKDYKRPLIGAFIMSVLPSSILYAAVYCSENVAIPFYLLSIYLFIIVINNKKNSLYLLLCGLLLSIGHLFRMIAYIVLIAYVMYIFIYDNDKVLKKLRNILFILVPFILLFVFVGNALVDLNITDRKLWNGSEPSNLTSAVRGSNIESGGSWNLEDAEFMADLLDDREALEKACKERIIERYTTTSPLKLVNFFVGKFTSQWAYGDDAGAYWSELDIPDDDIIFDISGKGTSSYQIVYAVILLLIIIGLFNRKQLSENKIINLFYIILCGFGAAFLILETQCRYAFIVSFIFAILPVAAFNFSFNKNK